MEEKFTIEKGGKEFTLHALFKHLKDHPNEIEPFKEGGDGAVYKFGVKNEFIIKSLFNSSSSETWFAEWVSKEILEKEKLSTFPLFIDKYDNTLYAMISRV